MKIKLYWPNCNLYYKDVDFNGKDALFLECSLEEAKEQLFRCLTEEELEKSMRDYEPKLNPKSSELGFETDKICFLISKDQKSLLPEPGYFPYSGQWNAYNPFRKIKEIEIKDISEITNSIIELEVGDISDN